MTNTVATVLDEVDLGDLGRVLPHEHIASVYGHWGQQQDEPDPEWEETVLAHYTPMLTRLYQEYDCRTIVEVSPSWGFRRARDLEVWAELTRRTGVNIVVSSGFYTARTRPPDFADRSANDLADLIIGEATEGVAGTSVKAGIIKIAVSEFGHDDRKLCRAAAIAQRETGLSITTHTAARGSATARWTSSRAPGFRPSGCTWDMLTTTPRFRSCSPWSSAEPTSC